MRQTTPPKCAHDTVWTFTTKCTRAGETVYGKAVNNFCFKSGQNGDGELGLRRATNVKVLLGHGLKRRDEVDHMGLARAGSVPGYGAQSAEPGPVERCDGSAIRVGHL